MNSFVKTAAAATFAMALIAGAGTSALAHEKRPVCPTAGVGQPTTLAEYSALNRAYAQYISTIETNYNHAVTEANTSAVKDVSAEKKALEAAKLASKLAKDAVKVAKDAVKVANDAVKADPSNAYKQVALEAAKVAAKAAKAEAKAAKDVVEAQRKLLQAERVAQESSRKAIREATEDRAKALKSCSAPKPNKGKKAKKG